MSMVQSSETLYKTLYNNKQVTCNLKGSDQQNCLSLNKLDLHRPS